MNISIITHQIDDHFSLSLTTRMDPVSDDAEMCDSCGGIAMEFFIVYPCNHRVCKSCLYPHLDAQLVPTPPPVTCPACHQYAFKFFYPVSNEKLLTDIQQYMYCTSMVDE